MRSCRAPRALAAAVAASNEIGALDERTKEHLFHGCSQWCVRVCVHSERGQTCQVANRREHACAGLGGKTLELAQPLPRVTAARLVHGWHKAKQLRSIGFLEPPEQQR